jgi:hypothetical protein
MGELNVDLSLMSLHASDECVQEQDRDRSVASNVNTITNQVGQRPDDTTNNEDDTVHSSVRHLIITDQMLHYLSVETARLFYTYKKCCILQNPFGHMFLAAHKYHSHFVTLREMSKLFPQKVCLSNVLLQFPDLNMRSSFCQNFAFNLEYGPRIISFNEFTHPALDRMCLFLVLNSLQISELT